MPEKALPHAANPLLLVTAETTARRTTAHQFGVSTGSIAVLAAVGGLVSADPMLSIRPGHIHAASLMRPELVRRYLRELVKAQMVERFTRRGTALLRLLPTGMSCVGEYRRLLIVGAKSYAQERRIVQPRLR